MRALILTLTLLLVSSAQAATISGVSITGGSVGVASEPPPVVGACTDGVDCFCDTSTVTSDESAILCFDWEDAGLYENTSDSWIAGYGDPFFRGGSSVYFTDLLTSGTDPNIITTCNNPSSPTLGTACGYGPGCPGGATGCMVMEYCSAAQGALAGAGADCWGPGVNELACVDIQRSGDFNAEVTDLVLTGGTGATSDVGAGNQHLAMRTPLGSDLTTKDTCGKIGTRSLGGNRTTYGVTMLVAYSSNFATADIGVPISRQYKHDEWCGNGCAGGYEEPWIIGNTGKGGSDVFPFLPTMFHAGSQTGCETALANATVIAGDFDCNSLVLRMGAVNGTGSGQYDQSTDWPFGTWGCVQAYINGLGTSDVEIKISFNEEVLIHIDGYDGAEFYNQYHNLYEPNNYTNNNSGTAGYDGTDEVGYRYQDNIYIRAGEPVSCASIGFSI